METKYNKEIDRKARNKKKLDLYISDCLDANICPNCGKDLKVQSGGSPLSALTLDKECSCGFSNHSEF